MEVESDASPTRDQLKALGRAVMRIAADASRETAEAFDPAWLGILRHVAEQGPARPSELAEALDVNLSSVKRTIRALREDDLVEIDDDLGDQRSVLVSPTEAGRKELRQIDDAGLDFLALVIDHWTAGEVCTLSSLLTRLAQDWASFQYRTASQVQRCRSSPGS